MWIDLKIKKEYIFNYAYIEKDMAQFFWSYEI